MKTLLVSLVLVNSMAFGVYAVLSHQVAPAITGRDLTTQQNVSVRLRPEQKGWALFFLELTCPCAKNCLGFIESAVPKLKTLGFQPVIVSPAKRLPAHMIKNFFESRGFNDPILDDRDRFLAKTYAVETAAEFRLLTKSGQGLYAGSIEGLEENFLLMAIEDLEAGRPLRISKGVGLGCVLADLDQSFRN